MSEIDDLLHEFLVESYESLDRLDGEFVALEEDPSNTETLSSIFRTIHTIKGASGFLDLTRLERITHAGENLLSALREEKLELRDEITTALLNLVDAVRENLEHIEKTGKESDADHEDLLASLVAFLAEDGTAVPGEKGEASAQVDGAGHGESPELAEWERSNPGGGDASDESRPEGDEQTSEAKEPEVREAKPKQDSPLTGSNIRVQVEQLDKLMNLAGELVLVRNQILQSAATSHDAGNIASAQRLNLITTELQERIMKVRMQPVGSLWHKYPRIVRDLSKQLGKSVRFQMHGKETELDKTLLEAIKDPLTHLVRNAVDHGIETPEERVAKGKDPEGVLLLDAYHESGLVHIEIVDDGSGLDSAAIKEKAVARGLITQEEAAQLSDRQANALIFHPGLSTAKEVTKVSGRGVGMDVVKTKIDEIGGTVEVVSILGKGTTVRIKIPLTLAIIPALIVTSAGDKYAIPQVSLVELVRLDGEEAMQGIEDLHGSPVYRLRGELLPLLFLDEQLGKPGVDEEQAEEACRNIVVVRAGDELFGLVVGTIEDTEEIVVKPLAQQTKSVPVFGGTTILGDGRVALILDTLGLATRAGVISEEAGDRLLEVLDEEETRSEDRKTYVVVKAAGDRDMAIELSDVDRLEEFPASRIERTGDLEVIQYRGEIMPLVRVDSVLGTEPCEDDDFVRVVVHARDCHRMGIIVEHISDIVETVDAVMRPSDTPGIQEAIVIDGVVMSHIDLEELITRAGVDSGQCSGTDQNRTETRKDSSVKQFCTFYLDDLMFGVDVVQVQEVLRFHPMTGVPLTSNVVSGLINLRGQTVTALDMRVRIGLEPYEIDDLQDIESRDQEDMPTIIVLRTGEGNVSILVDRIGDVLSVEEDCRAPIPNTVSSGIKELLTGVYKLEEALLLPLDVDRLAAVSAHETTEV